MSIYIKVEPTEAYNADVFIDFKHNQSYKLIGKGILKINEVQAEII